MHYNFQDSYGKICFRQRIYKYSKDKANIIYRDVLKEDVF